MKLTLKPHPLCKKHGELIDVFTENGDLPWATVHIDTFFTVDASDKEKIYDALYYRMEAVEVELTILNAGATLEPAP